jgi:hypothetical protein
MKLFFGVSVLVWMTYHAIKTKEPFWCFLCGWQADFIATEMTRWG